MTSTPALKAQLWRENVDDADLLAELEQLMAKGNEDALADAFFQDLEFGTAGLRGIVGVGTNRMNVYTVGKATQGFADYLNKHANGTTPSVAIARDSRHMGDEFTRHCASIFAANGIRVHVYPRIEPTPALSFAVRHLHCEGGICMRFIANMPAAVAKEHYELDILEVGVAYGTNIDEVKKIIIEGVSKLKCINHEKGVKVLLKSFDDSCITLRILVWVNVLNQAIADAEVMECIYNVFNKNGIEIPFPQREITIKQISPDVSKITKDSFND